MSTTLENSLNLVFDILAALISISDVATDVIVTYNFYQNDQMIFFGLSITFIILAQLSYVFAFIIVIGEEDHPFKAFLMFLCLLPISPLLSFIFYLTEDPNSVFSKFLNRRFCFTLSLNTTKVDKKKSKLKQWMKKKLRKHLGFIMESCIEALPQSIIQISAIVVYNNADIISIISILISMLSVSSKAFIFSIHFSINIKSLLFIWITAVTDFIGIFFAISWVLYNTDNQALSTLTFIWKMKILICVVPVVFCFSIFMYWSGLHELWQTFDHRSVIIKIFGAFVSWLMVQILWCFGMILGTMALEIATFLLLILPIMVSADRIPNTATHNKQFLDILHWIMRGDSQKMNNRLLLTAKQDKIIRTCCVNKAAIESSHNIDDVFVRFIKRNEKENFMNVTSFGALRTAWEKQSIYDNEISSFWRLLVALLLLPHVIAHHEAQYMINYNVIAERVVKYGVSFGNFVFGPLYYLSRIFNMLFPFMILINLYINGYSIFDRNDVDLFQCIMLLLYFGFIFILMILAVMVYTEHFYLWHIVPGKNLSNLDILKENIETKYYDIIWIPVRNALLHQYYGVDIAKIIIGYCDAIQMGGTDPPQVTDTLIDSK